MKKYKNLEEKIQSMTAEEIIMSMVDGLKNPVVKVDMDSFGHKDDTGICYGCAATNAICKLGDLNPNEELPIDIFSTDRKYIESSRLIDIYETAIDDLRQGNLVYYNIRARGDFAEIREKPGLELPVITNDNYQDEDVLNAYIELANYQD